MSDLILCPTCGALPCDQVTELDQWQPIETAPKDGTHILILGNSKSADTDYYIEVGYFWEFQNLCEWNIEIMDNNGKALMWLPLPELPIMKSPDVHPEKGQSDDK